MNRRHFLSLALTIAGAGMVTLAGCGGGGGGGNASLGTRRGVVQLPAGVGLTFTDLILEAGPGSVPLEANGAFTASVPTTDLPSLAMLHDKSGHGILMGFLPAEGNGLTTLSAAVALLYYALGGFMLPENARRPLVNLLESDAAAITLAGVIDRRMAANPYVLEADDAEVNAALAAAYNTLTVTGRAVRMQSFPAQMGKTRAESEPMLLVEPSGFQSNVEVLQATGPKVIATNHSRRYCKVYAYQTGTPDALPKAVLQGTEIRLDSTNALGIFSTINNLRSGQTAYVPVSTGPISLPLAAGSTKTIYEVIVVGGATNDIPRAFFNEAKYVDEQAKWVQARKDMTLLTWWNNLMVPVFFEAMGIAGLGAATSAVEASLAALQAIEEQSVLELVISAGRGELIAAAGRYWLLAAQSTAVGDKVRRAILPLYEVAAGQLAAETAAARLALFARMIVRAAVSAVVLLGAGDLAAVVADVGSALSADRWNVTVFQPDLILSPTSKSIAPGQRVTFSVKPPPGLNGTVSYAWTQTGTFATLSSADGVVGNHITTTSTSVDLVTTPSDQGKITVTVTATLTEPGGARREIGVAQAVITFAGLGTFPAGSASGIKGYNTGVAVRYFSWAAYTITPPPGNWTKMEVNATYYYGVLYKEDYDKGAAVADLSDNTDFSSWVGYSHLTSTNCFNFGNGTIGFLAIHSLGDFDLATEQTRYAGIVQSLHDNPATVTFT
ncbi:MAG: hypothetical protein QM758_04690 [Armatimonas sp.]